MEIHESHDVHPEQAHFLVLFQPSPEHELNQPLSVWFSVSLLDQQSKAIQLLCAAAAGFVQLERDAIAGRAGTVIFEGVFEESVVRTIIQDVLYPLLDDAQQIQLPSEKSGGVPQTKSIEVRAPGVTRASNE
jgi:hypothetical protein